MLLMTWHPKCMAQQIALLGRSSKTTKVGEICTRGSNIVVAKTSDCIDTCMRKMLAKVRGCWG